MAGRIYKENRFKIHNAGQMVRATWLMVDIIMDASLPENWLGMRLKPLERTWTLSHTISTKVQYLESEAETTTDLIQWKKSLRFCISSKEVGSKETSLYHRDLLLILTTTISHSEITLSTGFFITDTQLEMKDDWRHFWDFITWSMESEGYSLHGPWAIHVHVSVCLA